MRDKADIEGGQSTQLTHVTVFLTFSVEVTVNDPKSLLVFSGGQTRTLAQETEGDSYFRLAEALDLYRQYATPKTIETEEEIPDGSTDANQRQPGEMVNVEKAVADAEGTASDAARSRGRSPAETAPYARATTEQYALDSYQNLIFGICRFKE